MRGATRQAAANKAAEMFQFTPLVRGATESRAGTRSGQVSIHAPRARGDTNQIKIARENLFQFTPLVRGATLAPDVWILVRRFNSRPSCEGRLPKSDDRYVGVVSIHAPRARGDLIPFLTCSRAPCFNSRPSCEGRRIFIIGFDDTPVSIHAPRARGDTR